MNSSLSVNQQKVIALFNSKSRVAVVDVVKNLKIPRPTAKQVLIKLTELGILEQRGVQRGSYYTLKQTDEILDPSGQQIVVAYKGMASMRNMFDRLSKQLKKGDFYWVFASKGEYYNQEISELLASFHAKINGKGVEDKVIGNIQVKKAIKKNYEGIKRMKIRFTKFNTPLGVIILKKAVISLVWGKQPLAIVVKAPEIYTQYQNFFESMWKQSK
jgi:hypothetical protein